jgi:hypothetical protein
MSLINDIADLLRQHVGRDNAIKSRQIAECLGLPETADRTIRDSIADEDWEARELLVVASPGIGYYVASDISEADAYHALLCLLRDRAHAKVEKFRRTAAKFGITLSKPVL